MACSVVDVCSENLIEDIANELSGSAVVSVDTIDKVREFIDKIVNVPQDLIKSLTGVAKGPDGEQVTALLQQLKGVISKLSGSVNDTRALLPKLLKIVNEIIAELKKLLESGKGNEGTKQALVHAENLQQILKKQLKS